MTKQAIIDQIKFALGIDFMNRTVAAHFDMAFNTVVGQLFKQNPNQHNYYAKEYTINITHSAPRAYAMLPVAIIQTPDNAQGVRAVYAPKEDGLNFVPMPASGFQIYGKLAVGRTGKVVGYFPKPDRIEFMPNLPHDLESVRAELVRPFSAYEEDEQVPLPDGSADIIIQMVLQTMRGEDVKTNIYKK